MSTGIRNPLKQPSEPQGRALKRFCVELIGRLRRALNKEEKNNV